MRAKMTSVGPHRDDFSFLVGDVDIRSSDPRVSSVLLLFL